MKFSTAYNNTHPKIAGSLLKPPVIGISPPSYRIFWYNTESPTKTYNTTSSTENFEFSLDFVVGNYILSYLAYNLDGDTLKSREFVIFKTIDPQKGTCTSETSCICQSGYDGPLCATTLTYCFGIVSNNVSTVCSGRGSCIAPDVCSNGSSGWNGSQCHIPFCYGFSANSCS